MKFNQFFQLLLALLIPWNLNLNLRNLSSPLVLVLLIHELLLLTSLVTEILLKKNVITATAQPLEIVPATIYPTLIAMNETAMKSVLSVVLVEIS